MSMKALATMGHYVLIGLHAMAALLHHYVMRDNTWFACFPVNALNCWPQIASWV